MLRYAAITILIAHHSLASNQKRAVAPEAVNDALSWIKDIIPTDSNAPREEVNLDPSDIVIKNSSLSQPAEPANKFDNRTNSTPQAECTTGDGEPGVCVVYYMCDPGTGQVITDGSHLLDVRFGNDSAENISNNCPNYLDICCQRKGDAAVGGAADTGAAARPHIPQPPTNFLYKEPSPSASAALDQALGRRQCGWQSPELTKFQESSRDERSLYADYGEFPWMVALLRKSGTKVWVQNDYIGGGSLIHPAVVVTANHKLLRVTAAELKCRAGEYDTQTERELYPHQERDADRFVSHPDFYQTSLLYDIALVFLKKPFELAGAPHIGTACLAPVLPDQATCFSMGWGKDTQTEENVHLLKKVKLSLVEHQTCQEMLHTNTRFKHIPNFVLDQSLTCAGGEEYIDTCQGDGGSSLVCPIGHRDGRMRYAVVGMVAYGLACGKRNVPGVYVNVPHVYEWVRRQMADNGYTHDTYTY